MKTTSSIAAKPTNPTQNRRIGFMKGKISIPADFDTMGKEEIEKLFLTIP